MIKCKNCIHFKEDKQNNYECKKICNVNIYDKNFEHECKLYEDAESVFSLYGISGSLLRSKAKEYAKFKHEDEYNDPIYHRDVLETLNDFEAGYEAALKDCHER